MLLLVLALVLLATLALLFIRRRQVGRLGSLALLVSTAMLMIWMQDRGLLPNPRGMPGPISVQEPETKTP